ncbi:hypothetical protein [Jidongwangia harbinensis]|uniref:hypothetical protein n=1 Tax=Jidongwangia harbinensis TaxID=2878561 RepID=UPI001CD93061|nr:hypothetical protein [Jidongwangia harbinensis]MCA2215666.1 hypothetical protein [Jidongwangia harbinensis]
MSSARRVVLAAALAAASLTAGCSGVDEASAQGLARNDLVSELASQLSTSGTLTYSAAYHVAGGARATVVQAQNPSRTAYLYAGGRVVVTETGVTECRGTTCTVTPPPKPGTPPSTTVFRTAQQTGMIAPGTVMDLLNAASLDTEVVAESRDTTIAGHHATCLALSGVDDAAARDFSACVTNDGVLGSFQGTIGGATIDIAMTEYSAEANDDAFRAPPSARVVDRRSAPAK